MALGTEVREENGISDKNISGDADNGKDESAKKCRNGIGLYLISGVFLTYAVSHFDYVINLDARW